MKLERVLKLFGFEKYSDEEKTGLTYRKISKRFNLLIVVKLCQPKTGYFYLTKHEKYGISEYRPWFFIGSVVMSDFYLKDSFNVFMVLTPRLCLRVTKIGK